MSACSESSLSRIHQRHRRPNQRHEGPRQDESKGRDAHRTYKGFNFFSAEDRGVLLAIVRGENVITGFRHADLSQQLPSASTNQVSRYIKRLRGHGILKRIGRRYKYYITDLGRRIVLTGLKLRERDPPPQCTAVSDLIADT